MVPLPCTAAEAISAAETKAVPQRSASHPAAHGRLRCPACQGPFTPLALALSCTAIRLRPSLCRPFARGRILEQQKTQETLSRSLAPSLSLSLLSPRAVTPILPDRSRFHHTRSSASQNSPITASHVGSRPPWPATSITTRARRRATAIPRLLSP